MADVYLHVGLPKTGTTTIQAALEHSAAALSGAGVLYPGGRAAQRMAAFDLVGQRMQGDERRVVGALDRLVEEIAAYAGRSVIVSEEELGLASPRRARRLVRGLAGHRCFVVLTVRDMARTVVSSWQQSVVMGKTTRWAEYVAAVRDLGHGDVAEAAGFWMRQDLLRVMDTWASAVAQERIRVVTVPPRGAAPSILLHRFAEATGLPSGIWGDNVATERYVSFGAAELEVIRRLNERVMGPLNLRQHRLLIEDGVRPGLDGTTFRPLTLPAEHLPWARAHGRAVVEELRRRGTPVFGDLDDLVPPEDTSVGRRLDEISQSELLSAAEGILASLATAHGELSWRFRKARQRVDLDSPGATASLASLSRRTTFRFKKLAAQHANDNRLFAKAARTYVKRGR